MSCRFQGPLKQWEGKQKENKVFFLLALVTGSPVLSEGATTTEHRGAGLYQRKVEVQAEEIPVLILPSPLLVECKATIKD